MFLLIFREKGRRREKEGGRKWGEIERERDRETHTDMREKHQLGASRTHTEQGWTLQHRHVP